MPEPGSLLKLASGLDWHNAYIIDRDDSIKSEIHFTRDDLALFVSSKVSKFENIERYRCIVGNMMVLFNSTCLVEVKSE